MVQDAGWSLVLVVPPPCVRIPLGAARWYELLATAPVCQEVAVVTCTVDRMCFAFLHVTVMGTEFAVILKPKN